MKKNKKKSKFGANITQDRERREKEASGFGYLNLPKDIPVYKEKKGTYQLDIMPYIVSNDNHPDGNEDNPDSALKGNQWFRRPIWTHRDVGAENETVICPKTDGKKCPICETRDSQFREGMDKDDVVRKASARGLYLVIPKKHKKYDEEYHIWDISDFCFQAELDDELEENPDHGVFPDLENGETLSIRFKEDSFANNKFAKAKRINFLERKKQYPADMIDDAPCLDDLFDVPTYKELEAKFLEIEEEDGSEKKEKEKEKDGKTKNKKRKTKAFDDDLDEPKEEEKKMKRKKKDEKDNKCPEGYKYGKDWDAYTECDECPVFKPCGKKHKELTKA